MNVDECLCSCNLIMYFNIRFELKKIGEMTEEDLKDDSDDSGPELFEVSEDQNEDENIDESEDKEQHKGAVRSITAAKILKADLAC